VRGSEWGIYFSLYTYVPDVMLIGILWVSFLFAAGARRCENYNLEIQISRRACSASRASRAGPTTYGLKQSAQSKSVYTATPQ